MALAVVIHKLEIAFQEMKKQCSVLQENGYSVYWIQEWQMHHQFQIWKKPTLKKF